ncbi:MAG: response regulator [Myxococcota bacterium]
MTHVRVMIVEDEQIVAAALEMALRQVGYDVVTSVPTGEEAVSEAAERKPDVILMDISLAGEMDGVEAARSIHDCCGVPVIYLTAYSDPTTLRRAGETEPYGYLLKPLDERALRPTIEMALTKHRLEREREELIRRLQAAMKEIEHLRGILPICGWCRKIRDDDGYWKQLEEYLGRHLDTRVSHGLCPECERRLREEEHLDG